MYSQELLLYGGENHKVYLGCLNCSDLDTDSIWNDLGDYGTNLSSISIWNDLGDFGYDLSDFCPWNYLGSNPPIIIDTKGNFYGYLTINELVPNRAEFQLVQILYKNHNQIMNDIDVWYQIIFE